MIELRALGPPAVEVDGEGAPRELTWRKNLALLLYLARSPDRCRTREHLATLLWGEKNEEAARHSLNEALRTLRQHGGEDLVVSDGRQVVLDGERVRLDTERLEDALEAGDWEAGAELVRGVFLEGFGVPDASGFEDWMSAERRLWTDRSIRALSGLVSERLAGGKLEEARRAAERIRRLDPRSSSGVRGLMKVRALAGERAEALEAFEAWADDVRAELGLEPDPETQRLADRIRRERLWGATARGQEGEEVSRPVPLVGREEELRAVASGLEATWAEPGARLVVVEGDPGAGRSRLLEEAARRARLAGAVTLTVRAVPADRDEPHAALVALCRDALLEAPGLLGAPAEALAAVAERLPAWRERFADEVAGAEAAPLGRALGQLLGAVLDEQPVVVAVDDAEHLDEASAGALERSIRDHRRRPLSLLLVKTDVGSGGPADRLASRIGRDVEGSVVRVEPLSREALGELARALLPDYGSEQADRLARRLVADTGGLPALAVRVLEAVSEGLELEEAPDAWPAADRTLDHTLPGELPGSVTAAVRVGFRTLSPEAQEVLGAASVLGERVSPDRIVRATGRERGEVERALDELERTRWLEHEPRGYAFVARVVRAVVARDMLTDGQRSRFRELAETASDGVG